MSDEPSTYRPGPDRFRDLLDLVADAAVGQPLRPELDLTPAGLRRGEIDRVKLDLPTRRVAGLVVDRFEVEARRLRVRPGLAPVLVAEPVLLRAVVSQAAVDHWTRELRLPVRLRLTEAGVVTTTGVAGVRLGEVVTEPAVVGGLLQLRPTSASLLGVPAPLVRFLRGYLPLPPLPRSARVHAVAPGDGELAVTFRIDRVEQALTPDITSRLRDLLDLPLPGLR